MATARKARVKVRGACPAGHITEAVSDPGRVTWKGPCAHDGCTATVIARRAPADPTDPTPAAPVPVAAAGEESLSDPDALILEGAYDVEPVPVPVAVVEEPGLVPELSPDHDDPGPAARRADTRPRPARVGRGRPRRARGGATSWWPTF